MSEILATLPARGRVGRGGRKSTYRGNLQTSNRGNSTQCYGTGKTAVIVDVMVDVIVDAEVT